MFNFFSVGFVALLKFAAGGGTALSQNVRRYFIEAEPLPSGVSTSQTRRMMLEADPA